MVLLAVLTLIAGYAFLGSGRSHIEDPARARALRVAAAGALVTYIVLLSGAYVVGARATDACTSWPGCTEASVPFVDGAREQSIHWLHRFVVVGGLMAVASVATALLRLPGAGPLVRRAAWLMLGL
jgi:heme A synthase